MKNVTKYVEDIKKKHHLFLLNKYRYQYSLK